MSGSIKVICGSMFSGKTEELLRLLKRAQIAKLSHVLIKPKTDTRGKLQHVNSHNNVSMPCITVSHSTDILQSAENHTFVAIDEAQFFDEGIVYAVEQLATKNKTVIVSGLDMDYTGKAFGPMPQLMAIADSVLKLHAICSVCGKQAQFSKRISDNKQQVLIGSNKAYIAVCREHFYG